MERLQKRNQMRRASDKSGRMRRHATELALFFCLVVIFYAALKYLAHVP